MLAAEGVGLGLVQGDDAGAFFGGFHFQGVLAAVGEVFGDGDRAFVFETFRDLTNRGRVKVLGEEDVARADPRVGRPVLERPLDRQAMRGREVLEVRTEAHQIAVLGQHTRLIIAGEHRDRGHAQALDQVSMLEVGVQ